MKKQVCDLRPLIATRCRDVRGHPHFCRDWHRHGLHLEWLKQNNGVIDPSDRDPETGYESAWGDLWKWTDDSTGESK